MCTLRSYVKGARVTAAVGQAARPPPKVGVDPFWIPLHARARTYDVGRRPTGRHQKFNTNAGTPNVSENGFRGFALQKWAGQVLLAEASWMQGGKEAVIERHAVRDAN